MNRVSIIRCLGGVVILLPLLANQVFAVELVDFFKRSDQRAVELLEQGQHDEAAALFEDRQWRGVSQYRAGKFDEAMQDFEASEDARSLFNHGTAAARAGDYAQAVKSLETAVGLEPDNKEFAHNLDIAQKLKELAEKNQSEQQQQQNDEGENQDQEDQEKSDSEEQSEGDESEQSQEQPADSEQASDDQQSQGEKSGDEQQNEGDLSADAGESPSEKPLEPEDFKVPESEPQNGQPEGEPEESESEATAAVDSSVSEDDQATQQWLRRIPDDASQLLRNKIRLNHMIEYPEVNHMQEPW